MEVASFSSSVHCALAGFQLSGGSCQGQTEFTRSTAIAIHITPLQGGASRLLETVLPYRRIRRPSQHPHEAPLYPLSDHTSAPMRRCAKSGQVGERPRAEATRASGRESYGTRETGIVLHAQTVDVRSGQFYVCTHCINSPLHSIRRVLLSNPWLPFLGSFFLSFSLYSPSSSASAHQTQTFLPN